MDTLLRIPQAPGSGMQLGELSLHATISLTPYYYEYQYARILHTPSTQQENLPRDTIPSSHSGRGGRCSRTSRLFGRPVPLRTWE